MIAISRHAKQRLIQRRGVKHMQRHINKIKSWNLPSDCIAEHKGWRYVVRGGGISNCFTKNKSIL